MEIAIIIPAYNEAPRLGKVLAALSAGPQIGRLLVVDDGSTDGTAAVARAWPEVEVLQLPENRGKGAAMWAGALACREPVLVFVDADLVGLTPEHVRQLAEPVTSGAADMALGLFRGGRGATDLSHVVAPWITGQRAIRREAFLRVEGMAASRHGAEALLTRTAHAENWRVAELLWAGVTHTMKEEKLGLYRGALARLRMYREVLGGWLRRPARRFSPSPSSSPQRQQK